MAEKPPGAAEAQRVDELKAMISRLRDAEAEIRGVRQGLEAEVRELTKESVLQGIRGLGEAQGPDGEKMKR